MIQPMMTQATTRPISLNVKTYGNEKTGDPLILLHGLTGTVLNWIKTAKALENRCHTITYDLRGHGKSEALKQAHFYTLDNHLLDLEQIASKYTAPPFILGGLSMGSTIALQYALRNPDKVKALILVSYPADRKDKRQSITYHAEDFANTIDEKGMDKAGEKFVWGNNAGFTQQDKALIKAGFKQHKPHGISNNLRSYIANLPDKDTLLKLASQLKMPVLIIAGSKDKPSLEISQELAKHIPNNRLVIISDGGHVVNLDQPKAFHEHLNQFLDEHASKHANP